MIEHKCHRCGSARLEPGSLSPVSVTFRPANTRFLTLRTNDVDVQANMCLDCGLLQLVGDVRKAQLLAGESQKPH
jgi:ferredoxin-like protein FixX